MVGGNQAKMMIMAVAEQSKISKTVDKQLEEMYGAVRLGLIKSMKNGRSLSSLERDTGVSRTTLSEMANNRRKSNLSMVKYLTICEALDIKVTIG